MNVTTVPPVEKILEAHDVAIEGGVVGSTFLPSGDGVDTASKLRPQGWQVAAWRLWGCVGPLQFPTNYIARVISRRIAWKITPEGASEALDENVAAALLSAAVGRIGLEEFARLVILNIEVAGEFWLVRERADETDPGTWSVYSVVEPKLKDKTEAAEDAGREVQRIYVPDPRDTSFATSSFTGIIDDAEDLLALRALSGAQSRSRIAQAGILVVPKEAQFDGDPFGAGLEEVMTRAIANPHSAAAMAPIKVTVPAEMVDKIRQVVLSRPFDEQVPSKIEAATRRIALGLDIPPELLLGMGDQNHWSAWVTQEETYRGSIAPLAELLAGLLEYVIRVALDRVVTVEPDPTELLARRATPQDAVNAASIGAVSLRYVRRSLGASEDDAQPPEDTVKINELRSGTATAEPSTTDATSPPNGGVEP